MIALSPEEGGQALGLPALPAPVGGVSIDSRSIRAGDLFVALRGERFDGHDFVEAALAGGASGAVVERSWAARRPAHDIAAGSGAPLYEVDDTLRALWRLATEVRRKSEATVFAITGSAGKTSTKDLLGAMVARVKRVVATSANQNNEVGVALTLLSAQPDTEAIVLEMGMRGLGQIADLAAVAEPDIGVITNILPVHLELLGTVEGIAQAKAELLCGLRPGGVAVIPQECAFLRPYVEEARRSVVHFGLAEECEGAEVSGWLEPSRAGGRCVLTVHWPEGQVRVETAPMSAHTAANAVAAAAACYAAGLPVEACLAGVNEAEMSGGRGQVISLPGMWLIDDTYNANPAAVRAAIDHLAIVAAEKRGRAVAVLGDMLELGPLSKEFHREIGRYAAERGVCLVVGVGPRSVATVDAFRARCEEEARGSDEWAAGHVDSAAETSRVASALRPGDVVLFKASRSVGLERVVRYIVARAVHGMEETE